MSNIIWNLLRNRLFVPRPSKRRRRFQRLQLERLEDRVVPTVTVLSHYNGMDTTVNGSSGYEPPDTQGAAGPSSIIETVNQAVSIYTPKNTGSSAQKDTLSHFFFTTGGLAPATATSIQTDPFVIYDSQINRFIIGDCDLDSSNTNGEVNQILLAVSKNSNPTTLTTSSWNFFHLATTETGVALQDYPGNPGYNADALVITQASFDSGGNYLHSLVSSVSISALANGTPIVQTGAGQNAFQSDISEYVPQATPMPDSAPGGPMWLVQSGIFNGTSPSNTLDVVKMTNVLSASPTFTTTTLTVNPYYQAVNPSDPGGVIDTTSQAKIRQAAEYGGLIAAAAQVSDAAGDTDIVRWYEINVSSGTPVLQQEGDIGGAPNVFDARPGININAQGDIGVEYLQSGTAPGMFVSMYATGRAPTDAAGTMETPVLIQAGVGDYTGTRQGDMSRVDVDSDGTFWGFNQWTNNATAPNWGTAIANFSLGSPLIITLHSATEGTPLNNVPVATFIDKSGAALGSYTATINWGDGASTSGTVVAAGSPGTYNILGSHTYLNAGNYTLTVSETNGVATLGPVSGLVTVADAPLQGFAQALNTATANYITNGLVAVFTDTDSTLRSTTHYAATIIWNEGNGLSFSGTGTITHLFGNTFSVYGTSPYTFPSGGLFTVQVVIQDVGGASVVVNSVVSVAHNPAIPPLVPQYQGDYGPLTAQFVSLEDALTNLLSAERLFMFAEAFGTTKEKQGTFNNMVNAVFAYETAIFNFDIRLPGS